MKKVLALLLLVLMVSCFTGIAVSADATESYLVGDADGDGCISVLDATKIQRVLAELVIDEDGSIAMRGDVDNNGLDVLDATKIQRFLAGFRDNNLVNTMVGPAAPTTAPTEAPVTAAPTQQRPTDPNELPFIPV